MRSVAGASYAPAMDLRQPTPADVAAWEADWTARLDPAYAGRVKRRREVQPFATEFALYDGERRVGLMAVSHVASDVLQVLVDDIVIEPEHRGQGHARAAMAAAEEYAREKGAKAMRANIDMGMPAGESLAAGYALMSQHMRIPLTGPKSLPDGVTTEPLDGEAYDAWRAESVRGYAELNVANSVGLTMDAALDQAEKEFAALLPDGPRTEGHSLSRLVAGGEPVAFIWVKAFYEPGTHFVFDVVADPAYRGKGYGKAAMLHGENLALADGADYLKLNVHGTNAVAIGLYERLGYATVYKFVTKEL